MQIIVYVTKIINNQVFGTKDNEFNMNKRKHLIAELKNNGFVVLNAER